MLSPANLGGLRGVSDLHRRLVTPEDERWRGTFVFQPEHDQAIEALAARRDQVTLEAVFEGKPVRLAVRIIGVSPQGLAFFEGLEQQSDVTKGVDEVKN